MNSMPEPHGVARGLRAWMFVPRILRLRLFPEAQTCPPFWQSNGISRERVSEITS
jgi:hypothetical protein